MKQKEIKIVFDPEIPYEYLFKFTDKICKFLDQNGLKKWYILMLRELDDEG